jgi:hypothetical protein
MWQSPAYEGSHHRQVWRTGIAGGVTKHAAPCFDFDFDSDLDFDYTNADGFDCA